MAIKQIKKILINTWEDFTSDKEQRDIAFIVRDAIIAALKDTNFKVLRDYIDYKDETYHGIMINLDMLLGYLEMFSIYEKYRNILNELSVGIYLDSPYRDKNTRTRGAYRYKYIPNDPAFDDHTIVLFSEYGERDKYLDVVGNKFVINPEGVAEARKLFADELSSTSGHMSQTFTHELIHFLDNMRYKKRGATLKTNLKIHNTKDPDRYKKYLSATHEVNAEYQAGISTFEKDLNWRRNVRSDFQEMTDGTQFLHYLDNEGYFKEGMLDALDPKQSKRLYRRVTEVFYWLKKELLDKETKTIQILKSLKELPSGL